MESKAAFIPFVRTSPDLKFEWLKHWGSSRCWKKIPKQKFRLSIFWSWKRNMISLGGILFWIISCYGIGSLWDRLTQLFWIVNMLGNHQDFCSLRYRCFFCCLKNPPLSSWNFLQLPTTARLLRPPEPDSPPSHFLRSMISGTASMTMSTSCWEKRGQVAGKRRCFFWNRWKIYTCVKRNDSYMHIKNIYLHVFIHISILWE